MRLARVRGVTSCWLLAQLASLPSATELELLRDAGVGAIVVAMEGQTAEALGACREALLELPHEVSRRNKARSSVALPTAQASTGSGPGPPPEPEPDEEDWDDDP